MEFLTIDLGRQSFHREFLTIDLGRQSFHMEFLTIDLGRQSFHREFLTIDLGRQSFHREFLTIDLGRQSFHREFLTIDLGRRKFQGNSYRLSFLVKVAFDAFLGRLLKLLAAQPYAGQATVGGLRLVELGAVLLHHLLDVAVGEA